MAASEICIDFFTWRTPRICDPYVVTTGPEKSPGDPEGNPDDDLNGSMKDELSERGVPAERDPKEDPDPEAAEGGYVIRGAGGDDESGDPLGHAVPAAGEGHEGGDDDGGGDGSQDEAQHEAHCNTGKCYFLHVLQVNETGFDICNESKCSSPVQGKPSRRMERTATATAGGALPAASPCWAGWRPSDPNLWVWKTM